MAFILLKVVGTIGGYRGRAHFARRSGLQPLLQRRERAREAVDRTFEAHRDLFPDAASRVRGRQELPFSFPAAPALAAVLPVFARTDQDVEELRGTLWALACQTKQPEVVILVDDGSPADLSLAMEAWPDPGSLANVRMVHNCGPAAARSVGMRLLRHWAQGRRVIACLTDSDAAPDARWCEAMYEAQLERPGIVSGPTKSATECHTGRFHDHFGNLNGRWSWDDPKGVLLYGCTCNFSADLTALGDMEFDPVFSRPGFEDIELCWRARKELGVMTRYCEAAKVFHEYDRGLVGLYRQFWKYGNTEPIMAWMHPTFSFQGSRPVVEGFLDPRAPEPWSGPGNTQALRAAVRALDAAGRLFQGAGGAPRGRR